MQSVVKIHFHQNNDMKNQLALLVVLLLPFSFLFAQNFTGKYITTQNGIECIVEFKQAANQQVSGQINIGNEKGTLKGAVANGIASGTIQDASTQQIFKFEAEVAEPMLTFIMYVKDESSGVSVPLTFLMERTSGAGTQSSTTTQPSTSNTGNLDPAKAPKKARDAKLVGIWRTTETINSGSGEFYMGMSTDYFMQFTQEGIAGVWQGKSGGGGAGSSFSSEGDSGVTAVYWYSEAAIFTLADPNTKEEVKTKYQFHDGQLVTTNRNGKYVFWTKIQ